MYCTGSLHKIQSTKNKVQNIKNKKCIKYRKIQTKEPMKGKIAFSSFSLFYFLMGSQLSRYAVRMCKPTAYLVSACWPETERTDVIRSQASSTPAHILMILQYRSLISHFSQQHTEQYIPFWLELLRLRISALSCVPHNCPFWKTTQLWKAAQRVVF